MSNDVAIRIEYLGKRYRYGGAAPLSANLRADLTDWARGLWPCRNRKPETGNLKSEPQVSGFKSPPSSLLPPPSSSPSASPQISGLNSHPSPNSPSPSQVSGLPSHHSSFREVHEKHIAEDPNYFWALRDINLEVRQGEVVGIIGRNGAGKSTLLKILSRITPPTTGKITYNGRIASLLEVGTGFHRELTGRENIFLNGSILGMKRAEIAKKFDEIVAFAEVEKFIDTPVKFYSSGMYVRLAFAVAAHLEPEILVVDEVLAVGDASFQKKCLGKMGDVAKQGRTILFVSHNMVAIESLCSKAILLVGGKLDTHGLVAGVLNKYLKPVASATLNNLDEITHRSGAGAIQFSKLILTDKEDKIVQSAATGKTLKIKLHFSCNSNKSFVRSRVGIGIRNQLQTMMLIFSTELTMTEPPAIQSNTILTCTIPRLPLGGGSYGLVLFLESNGIIQDLIEEGITMEVMDQTFFGSARNFPNGWESKTILVEHHWSAS